MPAPGPDQWDWSLIRTRCQREARRLLRGDGDVEDVVQEALVRAWRSRSACRTPDAPIPWCLQITRNEALRLIGRRRSRGYDGPLGAEDEVSDRRASAEIDGAPVRIDLARTLDRLNPDERLLIGLRYAHDYSHPEIAACLRIPEATVRVRLHRAQRRLKPLLDAWDQGHEAIRGHHET